MDKGQSLVEFGVSLLILLFLLSGLVEFGIIFFQYVQLRDAAQEGALFGSACNCPDSEIEERVRYSSDTPINLKDARVLVAVIFTDKSGNIKNPDLACEGDAVQVRVHYSHKIFMPFLPQMLGVDYVDLVGSVTDTVLSPIC
jgi:Flp pilus assembly protein TadG